MAVFIMFFALGTAVLLVSVDGKYVRLQHWALLTRQENIYACIFLSNFTDAISLRVCVFVRVRMCCVCLCMLL